MGTKFYKITTDPKTGERKKTLEKELDYFIDGEWIKKTLDRNYKSMRVDDMK